jgi:hypothetical protein
MARTSVITEKIVLERNQWSRADFWHHCSKLYCVLPE